MPHPTVPLLDPQLRALATAAGLVGRPRLRAGLALTLTFACSPLPGDGGPGESGDPGESSVADASTTLPPTTDGATGVVATGDATTDTTDITTGTTTTGETTTGETTGGTTGGTLLTDATTFASETTDASSTGADDSTGSTGDTGELDDCVLDRRTMEMDWVCCEAQNWRPAPQCTPWGPPAPPTADHLLRARAARVLA